MSMDKYDDLDDILKKYLDREDFEPTENTESDKERSQKTDNSPKSNKTDNRDRLSEPNVRNCPIEGEQKPPKSRRNQKKSPKKAVYKVLLVVQILVILSHLGFLYMFLFMQVKGDVTLEAGQTLEIGDVVYFGESKASFVSEESLLELNTLGSHTIQVTKNNDIYDVNVTVVDTTKPSAQGSTIALSKALDIQPEQCVTEVVDATEITYSFKNDIDMESMEEQKIIITLTDEGGNTADVTCYLTLSSDVTAPTFEGGDSFESPLNEGISYKKIITVSDDSGEEVILDIDNRAVDVSTEGDYKVTYTATDHVGNVAVKEIVITVYKKSQSQELVESRAETVIADIIKDSMSDEEKATAIFYWVRENVAYTSSSIRNSWIDGAYAGLINKSGDCYVYAMTTKVLLDTAGIVNMDIEKIPASTEHFWNLVDVGNGWIHLDTTRRKDGTLICLWNNSKLMTYSNANKLTHNYDTSKYPTIN